MTATTLPAISDNGLGRYLSQIATFPMLSAEDERDCATRWRDAGDLEAAHRLVTSHLRLAASIAMGYRTYGLPISDLIGEANLGLMTAVKRFDPDKGARLSTYAMWWIKAAVTEFVIDSWSLVKSGTDRARRKLFFALGGIRARIGAYSDDLTVAEAAHIASEHGVTAVEVVECARLRGMRDASLDAPLVEGGTTTSLDLLADAGVSPEEQLAKTETDALVAKAAATALSVLDDRERFVVERRLMAPEAPTSRGELAVMMGLSHEGVRKIELRAREKMRQHLAAIDIAPELG